jgi:broad specificity phosphatase PhoE
MSTDNEAGRASGWNDPPLSAAGEAEAAALRDVFKDIRVDLVCCSDLRRAVETAGNVFWEGMPVRADRRLRETDYGDLNGAPREDVDLAAHLTEPFPNGESIEQAVARVGECLEELRERHPRMAIAIVGHRATRYALETLAGHGLADCIAENPEKKPYREYDL